MSNYKLKILLCGPAAVGKTSLIQQFIKSRFQSDYKLTVGVDILTKEVEYEEGKADFEYLGYRWAGTFQFHPNYLL